MLRLRNNVAWCFTVCFTGMWEIVVQRNFRCDFVQWNFKCNYSNEFHGIQETVCY